MTLKMIVTASAALMLAATAAQAAPKKAATAAASPTPAATAPAASAAPPLPQGPAIPGVCVYHNDAAISASLAGKAAAARMQQLKAQVSAELQAENAGIKTDAEAFQAKRASLTQEQLQQQAAPIQQRVEALDRKAQLRQRELEVTGQKAPLSATRLQPDAERRLGHGQQPRDGFDRPSGSTVERAVEHDHLRSRNPARSAVVG
jgi:Skp family chaperone for outer membrane proteins